MAMEDKIKAVEKITQALNQNNKPPIEEIERNAVNRDHFQSLIDTTKPQPIFQKIDGAYIAQQEGIQPVAVAPENATIQKNGSATDQEKKRQQQPEKDDGNGAPIHSTSSSQSPSSLISEINQLNSNVNKTARLSPEDLRNQAQGLIAQIENVKGQLSTASKLKPSYQNLLQNRLGHIDETLKIAMSKAGIEYQAPVQTAGQGTANPIQRFLGLLTQSQYQLEHLKDTIDELNLKGMNLTPARMLALQIKVGYVQQQIELFTNLLNKALESTKTIMNVQV